MILWFSGTGNSRYVAEKLSEALGEQLQMLSPDILSKPFDLNSDTKRLIWVFPVYSWGIPPYIRMIIRNIELSGFSPSTPQHLVITCGDDAGLTADMWRKEIKSKRWNCVSAYSVQMPNNYVCMKGFDVDSTEVEDDKLSKAPQRITEVADGILQSESTGIPQTDIVKGSFAWVKSRIIYPWFIRYAMSPKPFRYTSACISCGKCANICPLSNISMTSSDKAPRHPSWGNNCAGCLACYHVCPKHAVEYGKTTVGKGQYLNPLLRMNKN